jgi:hypothetical protein
MPMVRLDPRIVFVLIALVIVVSMTLILFVGDPVPSGAPTNCAAMECAGAFTVGNPVAANCSVGSTYAANGCSEGDATFVLTIESGGGTTIGSLAFEVVNTSSGQPFLSPGLAGFSVLALSGEVLAQSAPSHDLSMLAAFSYPGDHASSGSPMLNTYSVLIDLGVHSKGFPGGEFAFVARYIPTGATTASLTLP